MHVVAARNYLLKLPEQFACDDQEVIFIPITVIKQGEHVMSIFSWHWLQSALQDPNAVRQAQALLSQVARLHRRETE